MVTVPVRLMALPEEYRTSRVDSGGSRQLLLRLQATPPCGRPVILQALVDTGAETNLIRTGLFPAECFVPARDPLCLVTADGTRMHGGTQELTLHLEFGTDRPNPKGENTWSTLVTFHDAGIHVDAILSYPWLTRARLGVVPHLDSLVKLTSSLEKTLLLTDWREDEPPGVPKDGPPGWEDGIYRMPELHMVEVSSEEVARVRAMGLWIPSPEDEGERLELWEDEEVLEEVAHQLMTPAGHPLLVGAWCRRGRGKCRRGSQWHGWWN